MNMRELADLELDAVAGAGDGQTTGDAIIAAGGAIALLGPEAAPVAICVIAFGVGVKLTSN